MGTPAHTSGGLLSRLTRTVGAIALASGIAVTGVATSASADTAAIPLHNIAASNFATGSGECADYALMAGTSYWHFVLSGNTYSFASITLNLGGGNLNLTPGDWLTGDSGLGKQAYVAVPTGKTLASLQLAGSSATATPTVAGVEGDLPLFNLSHTCTGTTPPPPPATDVCNNIGGDQASIPSGMISDDKGGCITPPPPPPTDVCNNMDGAQPTIPAGLVSDDKGGCVTPAVVTPPTDVCNNIDGNQATIPSGMTSDDKGGCVTPAVVTPPTDVCNNIPEAQASMPAGLISDGNGGCVAPQQISSEAPVDVCSNIAGVQTTVPANYTANGTVCDAVQSEAVSPADVTLPVTGSNTASGIAIGLAMVAAGVILSVLARRRSARTPA